MILRRSEYLHVLELSGATAVVIHAVTQMRVTVTADVAALIGFFDEPHELQTALLQLSERFGFDEATLHACLMMLLERGVLTDQSSEVEHQAIARQLATARAHPRGAARSLAPRINGGRRSVLDCSSATRN
jgi:hypothetical protein